MWSTFLSSFVAGSESSIEMPGIPLDSEAPHVVECPVFDGRGGVAADV